MAGPREPDRERPRPAAADQDAEDGWDEPGHEPRGRPGPGGRPGSASLPPGPARLWPGRRTSPARTPRPRPDRGHRPEDDPAADGTGVSGATLTEPTRRASPTAPPAASLRRTPQRHATDDTNGPGRSRTGRPRIIRRAGPGRPDRRRRAGRGRPVHPAAARAAAPAGPGGQGRLGRRCSAGPATCSSRALLDWDDPGLGRAAGHRRVRRPGSPRWSCGWATGRATTTMTARSSDPSRRDPDRRTGGRLPVQALPGQVGGADQPGVRRRARASLISASGR